VILFSIYSDEWKSFQSQHQIALRYSIHTVKRSSRNRRIRRRGYNLIPAESKFKNLMLDHQDKYMMKAQRVKNLENDNAAQKLVIIKLKARVKRLEKANMVTSSKLRRLTKEDDVEVQEVVEVVTTAKLITKVVTAAASQVTAASATILAAKPSIHAAAPTVVDAY
nr:hypothetical protein [Tanacetum cinerariifolium]